MKKTNLLLCFLFIFFNNCKKQNKSIPIEINEQRIQITDSIFNSKKPYKNWQLKDIYIDSMPGISLKRANDSLLKNKKGEEVIIAILDSEIDINHEVISKNLWINRKEIANNNIDDDNNGYKDDVNGWNFLGNRKGENTNFTSYSYTRVLRKYNSIFENKKSIDIEPKDSIQFSTYLKAKEKYKSQLEYARQDIDYISMVSNSKMEAEKILEEYFDKDDYSINELDSLKAQYPENENLQSAILRKSNFINYGFSDKFVKNYKLQSEERLKKLLNLEYNDRAILGDNPEDLEDKNYGNNILSGNIDLFVHGTEVASTMTSLKNPNIIIMPLVISAFGDEYDKDMALAIRYAVDNGAKVINMSFGKDFSLHQKWVIDAFKYAERNNVIIISSAGNSSKDLSLIETRYPTDMYDNETEISDNFLLVSSISNSLDKSFISYFSNYGDKYVDVFAPGDDIFTALPNGKNNFNGGTSLSAAITSGVAALIFSYYPELTASEVKHILMDSGLEYKLEVRTPTKDNKTKTTPFNQLSKSGKVINAYNALIMADSISRQN